MDEDERRRMSRQNFEASQARERRNVFLICLLVVILAIIAAGALFKIGWNMF